MKGTRRRDMAGEREQLEDDLYRQVMEGHSVGALAREDGLSRPKAYRMVERAAERESWRIAGLQPPRPGAVIFTLGKGGVWRAKEYDAMDTRSRSRLSGAQKRGIRDPRPMTPPGISVAANTRLNRRFRRDWDRGTSSAVARSARTRFPRVAAQSRQPAQTGA